MDKAGQSGKLMERNWKEVGWQYNWQLRLLGSTWGNKRRMLTQLSSVANSLSLHFQNKWADMLNWKTKPYRPNSGLVSLRETNQPTNFLLPPNKLNYKFLQASFFLLQRLWRKLEVRRHLILNTNNIDVCLLLRFPPWGEPASNLFTTNLESKSH